MAGASLGITAMGRLSQIIIKMAGACLGGTAMVLLSEIIIKMAGASFGIAALGRLSLRVSKVAKLSLGLAYPWCAVLAAWFALLLPPVLVVLAWLHYRSGRSACDRLSRLRRDVRRERHDSFAEVGNTILGRAAWCWCRRKVQLLNASGSVHMLASAVTAGGYR